MITPDQIQQLPTKPGCYHYFDSESKLIYIGKAKNLRKRVSSYFQKDHLDVKTQQLVKNVAKIDIIITDSEIEALLLEAKLIKQYKPKYNVDLKHNERYAYLKVTNEPFSRLVTARKKEEDGKHYGPFVEGKSRALTLKVLNETFQLRTCNTMPKTVCLNYHIGLCSGPCEGKISADEYHQRVVRAQKFLKGDVTELESQLTSEMKKFAQEQNFELAKQRRDQLMAIKSLEERQKVDTLKEYDQDVIAVSSDANQQVYFIFTIIRGTVNRKEEFTVPLSTEPQKANEEFIMQYYDRKQAPKEIIVPDGFVSEEDMELISQALSLQLPYKVTICTPKQGEKKKLLELATTNADYAVAGESPALLKLKEFLKLPTIPSEIECYDISNLGNDYIVGAKIHFTNGEPNKAMYRRFRIKWAGSQNDFASMYEVIKRRFLAVKLGNDQLPNLVVIDGGKGQLGAALDALRELELKVPIIALAKREEEIFFPGLSRPMKTNNNASRDAGIRLLQRIRDETHRFVISYHRHLRDTKSFKDIEEKNE
ncbi:MAG TPA: excinuclease ABC subunit UvrC [Acidobacteriota bacterium]|nr:excinuclease ABC subunit UvrC [Acidobacteriota bacterium]